MLNEEIQVLDHGFVRLDGALASDLSVVNSARVSFGNRKEIMDKSDEGLIRFLMKNKHATPFEHNAFRWHVKTPIGVAREWQRHRIGSYNELSTRYVKFENPDFYVPRPEDIRTQVGKPGHYTFEQWKGNHKQLREVTLRHYQDCFDLYEWQIEHDVAREVARNVLPLALYTEFYWTVNLRSLMNFISLRNAPQALYEIREYAKVIEELATEEMPISMGAFIDGGRVAP